MLLLTILYPASYDIMANLVAYINDKRLVINHGLTVSEYNHGGLVIRRSGDSSVLGYVYIKHTVKILTHQKNTYLGIIFKTFIANQSRYFGTKVI